MIRPYEHSVAFTVSSPNESAGNLGRSSQSPIDVYACNDEPTSKAFANIGSESSVRAIYQSSDPNSEMMATLETSTSRTLEPSQRCDLRGDCVSRSFWFWHPRLTRLLHAKGCLNLMPLL